MGYVYPETNTPVPPDVEVFQVPAGISEAHPRGGWFTADGTPVTKLREDFGLARPEDPAKIGIATGDFQKQVLDSLARIEEKLQ